jgi:PTS system mannose-specific IIB component
VKQGPGVALIRVDNRLVHGQVLEAWLPALDAHAVLVVDDEAAGNVLARSAMALAIPPKVQFQVLKMAAAAELLKPGGEGVPGVRTLVLVRDVRDAVALHELGVSLPRLNLGNVHFATGRRQVTPSVYLDAGEMEALARLSSGGTEIEARAVPSEHPTPLSALQSRFAAVSASPR